MTPVLLEPSGIHLGLHATDRVDAVTQAGKALMEIGAVDEPYLEAMHERERTLSTFLGEGFALPHGTDESRAHVRRPAIAVLQFPDGVSWDGEDVRVAIAVASASDEHVRILAQVANVVVVAAASRQAQEEALEMAAPRGRVSLFAGLPKDAPTITIDANRVHSRELTVLGSSGSTPAHNAAALGARARA